MIGMQNCEMDPSHNRTWGMDNRRAGDFVSTSTILLVSHLIFPGWNCLKQMFNGS